MYFYTKYTVPILLNYYANLRNNLKMLYFAAARQLKSLYQNILYKIYVFKLLSCFFRNKQTKQKMPKYNFWKH